MKQPSGLLAAMVGSLLAVLLAPAPQIARAAETFATSDFDAAVRKANGLEGVRAEISEALVTGL